MLIRAFEDRTPITGVARSCSSRTRHIVASRHSASDSLIPLNCIVADADMRFPLRQLALANVKEWKRQILHPPNKFGERYVLGIGARSTLDITEAHVRRR